MERKYRSGSLEVQPKLKEADSRVSIIAISAEYLGKSVADSMEKSQWYFLELGTPDEGQEAEQFHNLFQDPTERGVIDVRPVTPNETEMLRRLAGWAGISGTDPADINKALNSIDQIDGVAIYDVGQGAATALLSMGIPQLYFDLGGSVIGNWRSFPKHLRRFCFSADPPVVLSHWDWDHWSSALRDNNALKRNWVLPIQSKAGDLGAVHSRFLAMLKANGATIHWWDYKLQSIKLRGSGTRFGWLHRANGPAYNRNESGLALTILGINGAVLLPGDSSLKYVTAQYCPVDHLMVPHHGGLTDLSILPSPQRRAKSHCVYSYGVGNTYLHPNARTVQSVRRLWKKNAHTALRDSTGLGHVGIDLGHFPLSKLQIPCGGNRCQLEIRQWI